MTDHPRQTVLVTGASRGIGLAVARTYVQRGADVALVACDAGRLAAAAAGLRGLGGRAHTVAADLSDPAECRRAVAEAEAALGPVDVLVSGAGILRRDFVEDVTPEDFELDYRLHVGAALWLTQALLGQMRARRRGRLVFISSELGLVGAPSYAAYCMSKAALVSFAETLRHELVGSGVRAHVVCPSDVRTEQLRGEHAWGPTGGARYEDALDPDDVAAAIVRVAAGRRHFVIVDRPVRRLQFTLMAGPRRSRFWPVHQAFAPLLRERRRR